MTIAAISKPPFSLKTLQKDSNCIAIQDPSAVWGIQDFLPRRNLLLATDTLATQNVTVVATAYKLYMQGTGSITLSGTGSGTLNGTGANDRVVLSFTPTAGTLTLTVSGTVTYGMLCRSDTIDQSYQKITDWTTEQYALAAQKQVPWLRRNRFVSTATLSTQTVSSVTATSLTVSFKGPGTITFSTAYVGSLVGTGANDRVTATFTPAAGNLVCTVSGTVTEAQCEVAGAATEYQPILASWDATYTANAIAAGYPISLWHDAAGTIAAWESGRAVGKMVDQKGTYTATQSTAANQPLWTLDANGKPYIYRDLSNDAMPITLPNLGSNCVIYTAEQNVTLKDSGITLNGSYAPITPAWDYGRIIMAGESRYDAKILKYLDQKRGRQYSLGPELVTNGGFSDGATGWSVTNEDATHVVTFSGGTLRYQSDTSTPILTVAQTIPGVASKLFLTTCTVSSYTSGSIKFAIPGTYVVLPTGVGSFSFVSMLNSGVNFIRNSTNVDLTIDNISVREVIL